MKFKPIALVVIGMLLGSTITLTLTRPTASTAEVLACTNKKSGKTRLTISDECNNKTESKSAVTDLWGLQPTSSTSTQPQALKKHVVDAQGRDLGELVTREGLNNFWTIFDGGLYNLDNNGRISGTISSWDPPIFEDDKCQLPYIGYPTDVIDKTTRAIVETMPSGSPSSEPQRGAFRVRGNLITIPSSVYIYVTPAWSKGYLTTKKNNSESSAFEDSPWLEKPGCISVTKQVAIDHGIGGRPPKRIYRSMPASTPVFTGPLSIVEK